MCVRVCECECNRSGGGAGLVTHDLPTKAGAIREP